MRSNRDIDTAEGSSIGKSDTTVMKVKLGAQTESVVIKEVILKARKEMRRRRKAIGVARSNKWCYSDF